jgi:hypothetical protein
VNNSSGLLLIVVGLGILWLAVTGKLTKMLLALSNTANGNAPNAPKLGIPKIPGISNDATQVAPYGINPELGTPRTRPQYDPNTPVKPRSSITGPTDSTEAGRGIVAWPLSSPVMFAFSAN